MRQLIRWAVRLYPTLWRDRYGGELNALLEDIQLKWQDLFNILLGALRMQMATWHSLRIVAALGLAGALLAGVIAWRTQEVYVSTAVIGFAPAVQADGDRQAALRRITQAMHEVMSGRSLGEMITRPTLDLYPEDRKRMPLEDVVESMRRAGKIVSVSGPGGIAWKISWSYPDKFKAQSVVRELVARLIEQSVPAQRNQGPSAAMLFQVLDPASLPRQPLIPNRTFIVTVGLFGGAVFGWLAVLVRRIFSA